MIFRSKIVLLLFTSLSVPQLAAIPSENTKCKVMLLDDGVPVNIREKDNVKLALKASKNGQYGKFLGKKYTVQKIRTDENINRQRSYKIFELIDKKDFVPYLLERWLVVKYRSCTAYQPPTQLKPSLKAYARPTTLGWSVIASMILATGYFAWNSLKK